MDDYRVLIVAGTLIAIGIFSVVVAKLVDRCHDKVSIRDDVSDISVNTRDLLKARLVVNRLFTRANQDNEADIKASNAATTWRLKTLDRKTSQDVPAYQIFHTPPINAEYSAGDSEQMNSNPIQNDTQLSTNCQNRGNSISPTQINTKSAELNLCVTNAVLETLETNPNQNAENGDVAYIADNTTKQKTGSLKLKNSDKINVKQITPEIQTINDRENMDNTSNNVTDAEIPGAVDHSRENSLHRSHSVKSYFSIISNSLKKQKINNSRQVDKVTTLPDVENTVSKDSYTI